MLGFECTLTCENPGQYSSAREQQQSQRPASPFEGYTHVDEVNITWVPQIASHCAQYPDGTVRCGEDQHGLVHLESTFRTLTHSSLCAPDQKDNSFACGLPSLFPKPPAQISDSAWRPKSTLLVLRSLWWSSQVLPLNFPQHLAQSLVRHS